MNMEKETGSENLSYWVVECDTTLPKNVKEAKPLAFAIMPDNFKIIISGSGHQKIVREYGIDKHDAFGGWINPATRKITFHSGLLGNVPTVMREEVTSAIDNYFHFDLRVLD